VLTDVGLHQVSYLR